LSAIKIKRCQPQELQEICYSIPELDQPIELHSKLNGLKVLAVKAEHFSKTVGFKIGYELDASRFYSWLGGVLPEYRKQGIGATLLQFQEHLAFELGYRVIEVKSMNRFPAMLNLLASNDYQVIGQEGEKIRFSKQLAFDDGYEKNGTKNGGLES